MFAVINEYFSTGLSNGNCDVGPKPSQPYTTYTTLHKRERSLNSFPGVIKAWDCKIAIAIKMF